MPNKKSLEEHLQYLELDQDSIFESRKVKDFLEPAMDEMLDNSCVYLFKESELSSLSCESLEVDETRSDWVTLNPC